MADRRFIEEFLPIRDIGESSSKEKRIRKGHLSTLHVWWARRPLAASRATIFSSFIPSETNSKKISNSSDFLSKLSKWEYSDDLTILQKARKKIFESNKETWPKILDPFTGGGSIPLEGIRLGLDVSCVDSNPVAVLIQKCALEYSMKYGSIIKEPISQSIETRKNKLIEDFEKWMKWVNEKTRSEIEEFYPKKNPNEILVGHIWCRNITCQNPKCGLSIPVFNQYWLIKTKKEKASLFPFVKDGKIQFKIVGDNYEKFPEGFNPSKGSISNGNIICQSCGFTIEKKHTINEYYEKRTTQKLICSIFTKKGSAGKKFRLSDSEDLKILENATKFLENKINQIKSESNIDPIPNEFIITPDNKEYVKGGLYFNFTTVVLYGKTKWSDLFNPRQTLSLIVFSDYIRKAFSEMLNEGYEKDYAKAIVSFLTLAIGRLANYGSELCHLNPAGGGRIANTFGVHVLKMVHNYMESNPFYESGGGWNTSNEMIKKFLKNVEICPPKPANVKLGTASNLPHSNEYFDAVITDPPYYDNIAYSYLSDFFYVWQKRILYNIEPDLFSTPLTPKSHEIISNLPLIRGMDKNVAKEKFDFLKSKKDFEESLSKAFQEIYRVLKKDGITIVVYAHKSTDGWETLIKSLLKSGLVVTAAWPLNTEMKDRLESRDTAALASSIYMIARKWEKIPLGFYRDVKKELEVYLTKKLEYLWSEGISGADFFISSIGSAVEVFGKYEKVVDDSDSSISPIKLLNDTRKIVTNYAINKVIRGEFASEISQMARFYILWRWAYGNTKVPYDDARKMAQSVGIDIEHEWNKGFIVKENEIISVLGPHERKGEEMSKSPELIDNLHNTLLLWKNESKESIEKYLTEKGYKNSEIFKRVAQAISESLPMESIEKKWLDGFLTGFKSDDSQGGTQSKLF
ncbi:Site-specific DNA-methyltransferase Type III restriction system mod subunit protein [Marine Group I thaumarchaeote SCGC RSA3]|uniref:Site-specific DNA-methyltransferase Type III restriction system mod subunit protein n=2 Tax=Marine Group I TaxID=905826 RepID=A0A081RND1_9ARCH|nr:Site-specific DNA-methyltransferase Type III restriction system mod subunit protein [Marine Group I thaumarchaeote SCGC AAA799-N04]KFM19198.1 Site-specific DNA-methyltransferase Type III restriction system mod subunit protein [Marine Group I thaumarchaeote SCGC RSA3]